MKPLDNFLRYYRYQKVFKYLKNKNFNNLLDIGCHDLYTLKKLKKKRIAKNLYGIDKNLPIQDEQFFLLNNIFPLSEVELAKLKKIRFQCIISMATFEHIKEDQLTTSVNQLSELLDDNGIVIITVPSPLVDSIINVLSILNLIDSEELDGDAHHHLSVKKLKRILNQKFIVRHHFFQLGLNNLLCLIKKKN